MRRLISLSLSSHLSHTLMKYLAIVTSSSIFFLTVIFTIVQWIVLLNIVTTISFYVWQRERDDSFFESKNKKAISSFAQKRESRETKRERDSREKHSERKRQKRERERQNKTTKTDIHDEFFRRRSKGLSSIATIHTSRTSKSTGMDENPSTNWIRYSIQEYSGVCFCVCVCVRERYRMEMMMRVIAMRRGNEWWCFLFLFLFWEWQAMHVERIALEWR